jgi:hypothetical protein
MTNTMSKLRERATGMCRPEEFMRKPGVLELDERTTGEIRHYTPDRNEEYELTLTVGVRYWANKAQRADLRQNAEAILLRTLYQDVLADLSQIRHAVLDGDRKAALSRICELESRLTK